MQWVLCYGGGEGGRWKGHPRVTFKEVKCSGFCSAVEGSGEWWKENLRIISEEAECSGFCSTVEGSGE